MITIFTQSLLIVSGVLMIYEDIKNQEISLFPLITFMVMTLFIRFHAFTLENLIAPIAIGLIFAIYQGIIYKIKSSCAVGLADLILAPFCGFWLNLEEIPLFLILTGLLSLCMGIFWRYRWQIKTFPLIPPLLFSLTIVLCNRCF